MKYGKVTILVDVNKVSIPYRLNEIQGSKKIRQSKIVSIPYRLNEMISQLASQYLNLVSIPYRLNEICFPCRAIIYSCLFQFLIGSMKFVW